MNVVVLLPLFSFLLWTLTSLLILILGAFQSMFCIYLFNWHWLLLMTFTQNSNMTFLVWASTIFCISGNMLSIISFSSFQILHVYTYVKWSFWQYTHLLHDILHQGSLGIFLPVSLTCLLSNTYDYMMPIFLAFVTSKRWGYVLVKIFNGVTDFDFFLLFVCVLKITLMLMI